MLWRQDGTVPHRLAPALITNVSLGGVQLRTRADFDGEEELLLQLGSEEGPVFIPGKIKYTSAIQTDGFSTLGFSFLPKTLRDREAVARYVLNLQERVCSNA